MPKQQRGKEPEGSARYTDEWVFGEAMRRMATWPAEKQRAWIWAINNVAEVVRVATTPVQPDESEPPLLNSADMQVYAADRDED